MKLKQYQIDRILDLRQRLRMGVEAIADKTGHSKNTVKKYLRLYGLLNYTYSPYQDGPPSLVSPSQTGSYAPQQEIDDLRQRGGRLIKKLDETFVSLDKANEQIQALKSESNTEKEQSNTQIMQLKHDLEKAAEREQNLTTKNNKLTEITTQQATEIESVKLEKDGLQKTVKEQKDEKIKMVQDHQRDLDKLIKASEQYVIKLAGDHQGELEEQRNKNNEALENQRKEDAQKFETEHSIYEEQTKSLKNEIQKLNGEVNISFWKGVFVGGIGGIGLVVVGTVAYQKYFSRRSNASRPVIVDSRDTTTAITVIPILEEIPNQPDYTNSGIFPETTSSGTLNCSGIYANVLGTNLNPESSGSPYQQNDMPHSPLSFITSGVELVTNISGTECSGTYVSSHLENSTFTSYVETPVYIPSPYQIPFNFPFISLPSPLPEDLSEVYPMNKWKRTTGTGFETCIEKLFIHEGCPTERLPYGNIAGDLIVTLNGVPTLIECKQQPKVGVETIQRTRGAMEHYRDKGVTQCMVITTGEFTKDAQEEAKKIGVTLWDGKRLLEEIYKAQFFYVPEDASEYDPNK